MGKKELIECICEINRSAKPEFLANFTEEELQDYLEHLMELDLEGLIVNNGSDIQPPKVSEDGVSAAHFKPK